MSGHLSPARALGGGSGAPARVTAKPPTWVVVTHAELPNGAAHRLTQALLSQGYNAALCANPLPGASRWRAEVLLPGARVPTVLRDEARSVPWWRETRSAVDVVVFARRLARTETRDVMVVGCDPVSFLEGIAAFCLSGVQVRATAAWFVDWSAQRLVRRSSRATYLGAARRTARLADVVAAITPAAAAAVSQVARPKNEVRVLTNQPLQVGSGPVWTSRPLSVVYVGGLSSHQGAEILLEAARRLGRDGITVEIAGGGPAASAVAAGVSTLPNVRFHGVVEDIDKLSRLLHNARVGLALYDHHFPQYGYGDSLKIKDYLAAGMRVVSTLPSSVDDGTVTVAGYDVTEVVEATRTALLEPPATEPSQHPLVLGAKQSLRDFVWAVEGVQ